MYKRVLIGLLLSTAAVSAMAVQPLWEQARRDSTMQTVVERYEAEHLEISTSGGYVYVTTSKPVTVKIFSILGQLISQEEVPVGTYRLRIASRGIYILKAGPVTRRITI